MKYLLIGFFIFNLPSCKKYEDCSFGIYLVPRSLIFIVKQDNKRLNDLLLDSMKLYYFSSSGKTFINDFVRSINEGEYRFYDLGLQGTRNIGFVSGEEKIKDYYLDYGNGDVDTLFVDYRSLNQGQACIHPCRCSYPLEQVKFNGKVASIDSSIAVQTVYIFNKN